MHASLYVPPIAVIVGITAWLCGASARRTKAPRTLIRSLHRNQTGQYFDLLTDTQKGSALDINSDGQRLYLAAGGWQGLCKLKSNARTMVQLSLLILPTDAGEAADTASTLEYMRTRAMFLHFLTWTHLLEGGARFLFGEIPYWSSQLICQVYWQMEFKMTAVVDAMAPDLYDELHQMM